MRRRPRIQSTARHALEWVVALESRRLLAADPSISLSDEVTVPAGKAIQIPIAGNVDGNGSLSYSVAGGTKAGIVSTFHDANNPYLDLYTTEGTLRFQLFSDVAPNAVRQISGLVASGYYDGLNFHRVVNVNGFQYAQGGDPNGDGTGGPQFTFDDEFDRGALFTGSGQLATANVSNGASGKDANGSQFIVTGAPARALDFNHTIFGQLVRGGKTLSSILNAATEDYRPTDTIRIKKAQLVEDNADAVLQLRAGNEIGQTTVLITARDSAGREATQAVTINVVRDEDTYANSPPILEEIGTIQAMPGQTIVIPIRAIDLEGDDYDIGGDYAGELESTVVDQVGKQIIFRVPENARGPIELKVGVKAASSVFRGNINMPPGGRPDRLSSGLYDTQKITIAVGDLSIERAVPATDEFAALPFGKIDDKLIATFRADGAEVPSASAFQAKINWGDGSVSTDAHVRELRGGQFAVYGTHQYDLTGVRPITVELVAENGSAALIQTRIRVAEPVALEGRAIVITGTEGADRYWLRLEDDGTISVNGGATRWPASEVDRIEARLYDGDDDFDANVDTLPPVYVLAGEGNDSINAGPGDDTIDGGAGDDKLGGNGGDEMVNAGDGDDTVLGGSGKNVLYGDEGDDRITGSGGRDLIYGGEGNDRLYGRGGDDTIDAGAGVDRLYGEDGNDLLIGGSGNDRVYGGPDDDTLFGKAGTDTLNGGPGDNRRGDEDEDDILVNL